MSRTIPVSGVAFVVNLAFAAHALCGPALPYGSATVDGNLGDWVNASWNSFDTNYWANADDIVEGAWAARWTANKVYMAVKVRDTEHIFKDSYDAWNSRDAVEMYIHTTGVGGNYAQYQEPAQEWVVGMTKAADGSLWKTCGDPISYGNYAPTATEFEVVGAINGDWLYYEAAIAPLQYFGGRKGAADIVSPLSAGMTIGLDCDVVSAWRGMKCSSLGQAAIGGWYGDYSLISQHTLAAATPEPGTLLLLAMGAVGLLAYARCRAK